MYVKDYLTYTSSEIKLLLFIARTGFYTDSFKNNLRISNVSVMKLMKKGLIVRNNPILLFGKFSYIYTLTDNGIDYVKNIFFVNPYKGRKHQIEHDYILGKIYSLIDDKEKNTWVTETELMLKHPNEIVIDGLYTDNNGNKVGVEVLTSNYSKDVIKAKKLFIKNHCDKDIIIDMRELHKIRGG